MTTSVCRYICTSFVDGSLIRCDRFAVSCEQLRRYDSASCLIIGHGHIFPYRSQMREGQGEKGITKGKRPLAFTAWSRCRWSSLPFPIQVQGMLHSAHALYSTFALVQRDFNPSDLTEALHCISIPLIEDKTKRTRLIHLFVISARNRGLCLRHSSATFSLHTSFADSMRDIKCRAYF